MKGTSEGERLGQLRLPAEEVHMEIDEPRNEFLARAVEDLLHPARLLQAFLDQDNLPADNEEVLDPQRVRRKDLGVFNQERSL